MDYHKKIDFAIKLLKSIPVPDDGFIELSYSGGKDSDVILELAKMAEIPFRAIYKNTTIDPPQTLAHCESNGVEILSPVMSFFDLVAEKGCPTRRARFCCSVLKEYKVLDCAIQGIRRCESTKRAERYKEPEICRTYSRGNNVRLYFPILYWTDSDVERFVRERGLNCHPLYYDSYGEFHVERRLGCIGCPLKSDNGLSDYLKYPKMLKQLVKSAQKFIDTHPNASSNKKFGSGYDIVFHNLFCKSYGDYKLYVTGGFFPDMAIDTKSFLERVFNIDLTL